MRGDASAPSAFRSASADGEIGVALADADQGPQKRGAIAAKREPKSLPSKHVDVAPLSASATPHEAADSYDVHPPEAAASTQA